MKGESPNLSYLSPREWLSTKRNWCSYFKTFISLNYFKGFFLLLYPSKHFHIHSFTFLRFIHKTVKLIPNLIKTKWKENNSSNNNKKNKKDIAKLLFTKWPWKMLISVKYFSYSKEKSDSVTGSITLWSI